MHAVFECLCACQVVAGCCHIVLIMNCMQHAAYSFTASAFLATAAINCDIPSYGYLMHEQCCGAHLLVPLYHHFLFPQVSVVSVGLDRGVFVWDLRSPTPVRVIPDAHQHEATCCAINGRGNLIATGDDNFSIYCPLSPAATVESFGELTQSIRLLLLLNM